MREWNSWAIALMAATAFFTPESLANDSSHGSNFRRARELSQLRVQIGADDVIRGIGQVADFLGDATSAARQDESLSSDPIVAQVVGGTNAIRGRYPFMCSLRSSSGNHFCGCSLVAPDVALTAAHCVDKSNNDYRKPVVHLGRYYRTQNDAVNEFKTVTTRIHPDWDPSTNKNDVALLLLNGWSLSEPVELLDGMEPEKYVREIGHIVPFPVLSDLELNDVHELGNAGLRRGEGLTVLGWGRTSEGGTASEILQEGSVPYVSQTDCQSAYDGKITEAMFCAGTTKGGLDSCQGDSGGPIIRKLGKNLDVQVGIVSWGYGCARPGLPGVYASISHLRSWIDEEIKGLSSSGSFPPSNSKPTSPSTKPQPHPSPLSSRPSSPPAAAACTCTQDGRSGNALTPRKGCQQHLKDWGDDDFFCMVLGGSECESASESAAYPGAAWKHCDQHESPNRPSPRPKPPSSPNRRPRPALSGNLSFGGLGLSINFGSGTSAEKVASQSDACTCSIDGKSGGQNTNYKGCQQHSWYTGRYDYWCMVNGGIKCRSATPSTVFQGAAWRSCET